MRLCVGLAAGIAVAWVDNFAFEGEVSPIVIVVMLLAATATIAAVWGRHGWAPAAAAWLCVPLAHLIKHVLGLPDTLHPNTYTSILMLAAFTFVVAALGTGAGMLIHRGAARISTRWTRWGRPGGDDDPVGTEPELRCVSRGVTDFPELYSPSFQQLAPPANPGTVIYVC